MYRRGFLKSYSGVRPLLVIVLRLTLIICGPSCGGDTPEAAVIRYYRELATGQQNPHGQSSRQLRVFLKDGISQEVVASIISYIEEVPHVVETRYISKEEDLAMFKEMYADQKDMLNQIEGNPLPAEVLVTVDDASSLSRTVEVISRRPEVSADSNGKKEVKLPNKEYTTIIESLRFANLRFDTKISGNKATVSVIGGSFSSVDMESGKRVSNRIEDIPSILSPEEYPFPLQFELEKRGYKWVITKPIQ